MNWCPFKVSNDYLILQSLFFWIRKSKDYFCGKGIDKVLKLKPILEVKMYVIRTEYLGRNIY